MKELVSKSKNLSMSRGLKWSHLSKNKGFSETKTDSCKDPDSQLDKLIQKELSLNETELSKFWPFLIYCTTMYYRSDSWDNCTKYFIDKH